MSEGHEFAHRAAVNTALAVSRFDNKSLTTRQIIAMHDAEFNRQRKHDRLIAYSLGVFVVLGVVGSFLLRACS